MASLMNIIVIILQGLGAILLIMLGIWSFIIDNNLSYRWCIIYTYNILFGLFMIVQLMSITLIQKLCAFMDHLPGKAFFSFFIGVFNCHSWFWLQTTTFSYFFTLCPVYLLFALFESEISSSKSTGWNKSNTHYASYGGAGPNGDILPGESI